MIYVNIFLTLNGDSYYGVWKNSRLDGHGIIIKNGDKYDGKHKDDLINGKEYRNIGWSDILFVALYNYQFNLLKSVLNLDAGIGSVDKFQG